MAKIKNAAMAHYQSDAVQEGQHYRDLIGEENRASAAIEEAIRRGEYFARIEGEISEPVRKILVTMGYGVRLHKGDEPFTAVYW